jgi:maleylpyruvate isomerase
VRPEADLLRVADAQRRFDAAMVGLGDDDMRRPTGLPGWTIGHVLVHVARNADSHVRRTAAAIRDEVVEQYPGGREGRAAEIEAGAGAAAVAILDDVTTSAAALAAAWSGVPDEAWSRITRDVGGRERPLADLASRRWQELEVHVVDLGIGVSHRDWPADFVGQWLPRLRRGAAGRLAGGAVGDLPAPGRLDERDELAWLYGRLVLPGLPALAPWS